MPDVTGYRAKIGVIVPSTNTVVEHDVSLLRPHGITFHVGRMRINAESMDGHDNFMNLIHQIREGIKPAIADVMTARPDYMMMGMSGETFWGGVAGHETFVNRVREYTGGLQVTTGAGAVRAALEAFGVKRIACITPYQPVGDEQVYRFFTESGFEVVGIKGLKIESATKIAQVTPSEVIAALREVDAPNVQAIVQCGTNLSMVRIADQAEYWLGKPVIAINAATVWHTLRLAGFNDTWGDAGRLLREF